MESNELSDSDVADALGEFVNIVGGNIKSALPGPIALSLPLVALGRTEGLIVSVWSEQENHNEKRGETNENSGG